MYTLCCTRTDVCGVSRADSSRRQRSASHYAGRQGRQVMTSADKRAISGANRFSGVLLGFGMKGQTGLGFKRVHVDFVSR